jgi:hypothetical protein
MKGEYKVTNHGFNQTVTINGDHQINNISKISWDANYNGQNGNMALDISKNGHNKHIDVKFNNEDLAEILNVPSVTMPLEQRLKNDFLLRKTRKRPMIIELASENMTPLSYDLFVPIKRKSNRKRKTTKRTFRIRRNSKTSKKTYK